MHVEEGSEEVEGSRFTLGDVWAIVQMQRWVILGALVLCVTISLLYAAMATRQYRATSVVHVSTLAAQEMEMGKSIVNNNLAWNRDLYIKTQIALLKSTSYRRQVLERYVALNLGDGIAPGKSDGIINRGLEVVPRMGTELLDIHVTTTDPQLSARLANLVAEVLRDESLNRTTEAALGARAWLEAQLVEYDQKISRASKELEDYLRLHDMADVEGNTVLDARLASLKQAFGQANTERVQAEALIRSYEELLKQGRYDVLSKQITSPLIKVLVDAHSSALAERVRLSTTYGPKWSEMIQVTEQIGMLEAELQSEMGRALQSERTKLSLIESRERDLSKEIGGGKEQMLDVRGLREDYEKKRLDLDSAKSAYALMMERLNELELQSKTQLNNVRIIEEARAPKNPFSPNVTMSVALGGFAGIVLGLGLAFLREWLDDTVSSPLDVSTYLRVPLLGMVPKIHEKIDETQRSLYTVLNPKSNVAEAVRGLRTTVELSPAGSPRRLLFTSALMSEGKTSTAIRLAIAFSNLNRRVLIIDADLRRPRVHKVFGGERTPGLATALQDATPVLELVRPTEVPNLFYLAAGKPTDHPNEVLASADMPKLLDELDRSFDILIIDTPPIVMLSDAKILARYADGVIVLAKEHRTSRYAIREAIAGVDEVGGRVLGLVLNEVDTRRGQPGYHYGYSYRYDRYYDDDEAADASAAK